MCVGLDGVLFSLRYDLLSVLSSFFVFHCNVHENDEAIFTLPFL